MDAQYAPASDSHPLILNLEKRDRLSARERELLAKAPAGRSSFERHQDVVRAGSKPTFSSLLVEGFAARYKLLSNGKRQIIAIHVVGDFVDLHSFLLKPMDHGVTALTPCVIAMVPHDHLRKISESSPHLSRLLWLSTLIDAATHREWLASIGGRTATERLAHLFCEIFVRLEAVGQTEGSTFRFPITQTELAEAMGLSLVHVNRTLQALRRTGAFDWRNGVVTVKDWERLQEIGDFDPGYLNLTPQPR